MDNIKDGLKFFDKNDEAEIIFNFYTFFEILKGYISEFCKVSNIEASKMVENSKLFQPPITTANDVYFFSHEHPHHWAMICFYGEMYWEKNPKLSQIPDFYNDWEKKFIKKII